MGEQNQEVNAVPSPATDAQAESSPADLGVEAASPADGGTEQSVPYSRFKEVNDQVAAYRDDARSFQAIQSLVEQAKTDSTAKQYLENLLFKGEAEEPAMGEQPGDVSPSSIQAMITKAVSGLREDLTLDNQLYRMQQSGMDFDEGDLMRHMAEKGIRDPQVAHRDLYFDQLVEARVNERMQRQTTKAQAQAEANASVGAAGPASVTTIPQSEMSDHEKIMLRKLAEDEAMAPPAYMNQE